jgi:hypothetical protein
MQAKFMPRESKYAAYSQDLILRITSYVPLSRARELLYGNGEMDPRLCALEVQIYQQSYQNPGVYVGYYKDERPVFTKFSDVKEAEETTVELRKGDNFVGDVIVVDSSKGGK